MSPGGKVTPVMDKTGIYGAPRFSPDSKKLAFIASGGKGFHVWAVDLDKRTPVQPTCQGMQDRELAWARDSKHLVYGDGTALWWIRDGSGQPQRLADKLQDPRPGSMAPDGRLAFAPPSNGLPDVWTMPIDISEPEHPKPGAPEPSSMTRQLSK